MAVLPFLLSVGLAAPVAVVEDATADDPLARAVETFRHAAPEVRAALVADIHAAIEASEDDGIRALLALRERAGRELKPTPWKGLSYYEPKKYAPLFPRAFVPEGSEEAERMAEQMRPWDNEPRCLAVRFRYDYGTNRVVDLGADPSLDDALMDLLYGYPPDADRIIAWLEQQFDFDRELDDLADYFGHAYCDREGTCFPNVTIYDVWSSQREFGHIEMPDGDAIAYAIHLLDDRSYHSPIPADRRRSALYEKISEGFLRYHRHRSWIEAAANVYLNPEAMIRKEHENLRERLWTSFGVLEDDVSRIASQFERAGDRNTWYESIDALNRDDKRTLYRGHRWREERNATRWVIAEETYRVLREYGML